MIREAIAKVVASQDLTESEMIEVMNEIMTGGASPAQISAFITALRMKGETVARDNGGRTGHAGEGDEDRGRGGAGR